MSKRSDEFIDSLVEWLVESEDEGEVLSMLKEELHRAGFNPSDELVALVTPEDIAAVVADEDEEEEDEDEEETEGYWGDDEEEDEDDEN